MIPITDIHTFTGVIPVGYELAVYERGTDPTMEGYVLYGFDEINMYTGFGITNPEYCFLKLP